MGNEIIERIGSTCKDKYLKFDEFLIYNYQLDGICAKLSSEIFALKKRFSVKQKKDSLWKFNKISIRVVF